MAKCWLTWAYNHNRARTLGKVTEAVCKKCGGPVWHDIKTGWYWCRNLDCNIGTTLPDGSEYIKKEFIPLSDAVRKFEDQ
jgi:hypothetical protein